MVSIYYNHYCKAIVNACQDQEPAHKTNIISPNVRHFVFHRDYTLLTQRAEQQSRCQNFTAGLDKYFHLKFINYQHICLSRCLDAGALPCRFLSASQPAKIVGDKIMYNFLNLSQTFTHITSNKKQIHPNSSWCSFSY